MRKLINKKVSPAFVNRLLERYPEVSFKPALSVNLVASEYCTEEIINSFFSNIDVSFKIHNYHQSFIFNYDEIMV